MIIVRNNKIIYSNNNPDLKIEKYEELCPECNGYGSTFEFCKCKKCNNKGKIDWINRIKMKSKI